MVINATNVNVDRLELFVHGIFRENHKSKTYAELYIQCAGAIVSERLLKSSSRRQASMQSK